jgi:phage terminase large subunit
MTATKTPDVEVQIDPAVFNDVYLPHLANHARTQIYYGGASSGKSWFIIGQRAVIDLMNGGRNYLICRAVARTIRTSVFAQMERTIREFGVQELFSINKSEATITCVNGYQAVFAGLDDVEKIKSITPKQGAFTDIVIEEATETERSDVKQLMRRQRGGDESIPKRLVLLFNPILRDHWIYLEYFSPLAWADEQTEYMSDELSILKTWYIHNKFLTEQDRHDLLSEKDKYFQDVYTFGNWGVLGAVIFTNWSVQDLSGMADQFVNRRNGLDFGFSSDPAAMPVTHYDKKHKTIYIFDELYETGLTNDQLAKLVKELIGGERVTCDSAEPKSIQELRMHGVNAHGAKKGKDSVLHGIQWLQQQTIIIDKKCVNTRNEFQSYKWKEDRRGISIRQPVDFNNHIIDALRYAYEGDMITIGINTKATVGNYIGGAQQTTSRPGF